MEVRVCKKCGEGYPLNKDNFGHMPSGGFRWACRKCVRKNVAKHSQENPEMVTKRLYKRKSLEKQSSREKDYEDGQLKDDLYKKQNGLCFYCQRTLGKDDAELEHMQPIIKGGSDIKENIVLACFSCNREKHNKTVEEYKEWRTKNGYDVLF